MLDTKDLAKRLLHILTLRPSVMAPPFIGGSDAEAIRQSADALDAQGRENANLRIAIETGSRALTHERVASDTEIQSLRLEANAQEAELQSLRRQVAALREALRGHARKSSADPKDPLVSCCWSQRGDGPNGPQCERSQKGSTEASMSTERNERMPNTEVIVNAICADIEKATEPKKMGKSLARSVLEDVRERVTAMIECLTEEMGEGEE